MSAIRTERLLNLLTLLLNSRRPISMREIREMDEFGAYATGGKKSGERAFMRDKAELVDLGVPIEWVAPDPDDLDTEGGYVIDRERYFLPELDLGPAELALLSIAGAAAVAIEHFPERAAVIRALAKLGFDVASTDAAKAGPSAALAHAPLLAGPTAERIGKNLEVLHDAVSARRRVSLVYADIKGDETSREVDPYGLYYRQGVWYLVGYCHLRQSERTFHLGRMAQVTVTGDADTFEIPDDFDLSVHTRLRPWEYPYEPPFQVEIRLADRLVPAIGELFGSRATLDGTTVRLQVSHRSGLVAAVLPFGAAAEVLSPADLRAQIGDIYEALAVRYGGT